MKFFSLKILVKNTSQWGINSPIGKLAVGADFQPWRLAVDRPGRSPTVKNLTVGASVDRPVDRPNPKSKLLSGRSTARSTVQALRSTAPTREWGTCSRSTARSTGPSGWPTCTFCARRWTGPVDRLWVRSTARAWQAAIRDLKT